MKKTLVLFITILTLTWIFITRNNICSIEKGWVGVVQSCACKGYEIPIKNKLAVDGDKVTVCLGRITTRNQESEVVKKTTGNPEPSKYANSTIEKLEFNGCSVYVVFTSGEKSEAGKVSGSGTKNPSCLHDIRQTVSSSGRYAAFEDISGGLDSTIGIYSTEQNVITTLYTFGTSTIMDFTFMPEDIFVKYPFFKVVILWDVLDNICF